MTDLTAPSRTQAELSIDQQLALTTAATRLAGTRYTNWDLDDPAGLDLPAVRPIRDDLEHRVRTLLDELGVPARS
jgi:hypothetical protein